MASSSQTRLMVCITISRSHRSLSDAHISTVEEFVCSTALKTNVRSSRKASGANANACGFTLMTSIMNSQS